MSYSGGVFIRVLSRAHLAGPHKEAGLGAELKDKCVDVTQRSCERTDRL